LDGLANDTLTSISHDGDPIVLVSLFAAVQYLNVGMKNR